MPPVGMNLYVICGIRNDVKMKDVIRGVFPFIVIMILFLVATIMFPRISLWLPSVMK